MKLMARRSTRHRRKHTRWLPVSTPRISKWKLAAGILAGLAIYVVLFQAVFLSPRNTIVWKAIFGDTKYPEGFSVRGIDISHYQGDIDWDRLHDALIDGNPIRFIIIKGTEGNSMLDENFNDNFYNAREYGFIRGAYHYFVPGVDAKSQADYFLKQVHLEEGDLPPVLDFEQTGSQPPEKVRKDALTWLRRVERKYGVRPILYTYYKFKLKYFSGRDFDEYPYWIAHYYVDTLKYKGAWKFWQHTDLGQIDGIKPRVDLNVYNGSMYDLEKFTIQSGQ